MIDYWISLDFWVNAYVLLQKKLGYLLFRTEHTHKRKKRLADYTPLYTNKLLNQGSLQWCLMYCNVHNCFVNLISHMTEKQK